MSNYKKVERDIKMTKKCTKCGGSMERGFLANNNFQWINYESFWGKLTLGASRYIATKNFRRVIHYKCSSCGFIELYAIPNKK